MEEILVVDDDPKVLALTSEILKCHGYEPLATGSPQEALETVKKNPGRFSLLLLDWKLRSHIDGDTVLCLVKRLFPELNIPIIFVTAHTRIASKYLMRLGAYETLTKPFTADDLVDAVERALRKKPDEDPHRLAPAEAGADELKKSEMTRRIVNALTVASSVTEASAVLGCSRRSLYRWIEKTGLHSFLISKEPFSKAKVPDAA